MPCQTLLDKLRQRGCRITPQREMIVEAIAHSEMHMTAEAIFASIHTRSKSLNLATVYRTLDLLVDEGLVGRANLGGGRILYVSDQHGPHVHLVCRQCGEVAKGDSSLLNSLNDQLYTRYEFSADFQHLCISGLCKSCQERLQIQKEAVC